MLPLEEEMEDRRKWRKPDWKGEENMQGAASQLFFPETRSSLLDNCRNRSALASTLVKHQWKVLPEWSAAKLPRLAHQSGPER